MEAFLFLVWVYAKCVAANKFTGAGYLLLVLALGDLLHLEPGASWLAWGLIVLLFLLGICLVGGSNFGYVTLHAYLNARASLESGECAPETIERYIRRGTSYCREQGLRLALCEWKRKNPDERSRET